MDKQLYLFLHRPNGFRHLLPDLADIRIWMRTHCCLALERRHGKSCSSRASVRPGAVVEGRPSDVPTRRVRAFLRADHGYPQKHSIIAREWSYAPRPARVGAAVIAGTLDDPMAIPPNVHIDVRSKLPWGDTARGRCQPRGLLRLAKALSCCQPEAETSDSRLMYRFRESSSW
jgi:hypothetical protein